MYSSMLCCSIHDLPFTRLVCCCAGYGQISPVTPGGQAFCCVYALFGIPIAGVLLVKLASALKDHFISLSARLAKRAPKNPFLSAGSVSLLIASLGVVIFIFIPAAIFRRIEGWSYGQSLYYCFTTLSTIGFGDFVPGQQSAEHRDLYKILVMLWICFGLAFLTLLLEIVDNLLSKTAVSVAFID